MSEIERKEEQRWRQEKRQREEQELRVEVERKMRNENCRDERYPPFSHGWWPRP